MVLFEQLDFAAGGNIPHRCAYEQAQRAGRRECSIPLAVSCHASIAEYSLNKAEQLERINRERQYQNHAQRRAS